MVQTIKTVIRPSRPNWPLIRPNPDHGTDYKDCDQTFPTKLTSDQTEPKPNPDLGPDYKDCDQTFQTELTSDQS